MIILLSKVWRWQKLQKKTAQTLDEHNTAEDLVAEITKMVHEFRSSKLPETRAEFENRAILFQFMNDLRYLLEMKRDFLCGVWIERKRNDEGTMKDD